MEQKGTAHKKIVWKSEKQTQTWYCGPHSESFTIYQAWNTVEWWRHCNSCSTIEWRVFSCSHVGEYSTRSKLEVKIKQGRNCLSLPNGSHAKEPDHPYGINEELKTYPCSSNDEEQDFFLYITDIPTNSKYKLRPVNGVNKGGIDVCVVAGASMKIYE